MSLMLFMRNNIRWIFIIIIISLIISLFSGIGSFIISEKRKTILKINNEKININSIEQLKNNLIMQELEINPKAKIDKNKISIIARNILIQKYIILYFAKKIGEVVSNQELFNLITNIPAFQKNKKFDINTYIRAIKSIKETPKKFEEDLKKDILVDKFTKILNLSTKSSKIEIEFEKEFLNNTNNIQIFKENFLKNKSYINFQNWYQYAKKHSKIKINNIDGEKNVG